VYQKRPVSYQKTKKAPNSGKQGGYEGPHLREKETETISQVKKNPCVPKMVLLKASDKNSYARSYHRAGFARRRHKMKRGTGSSPPEKELQKKRRQNRRRKIDP